VIRCNNTPLNLQRVSIKERLCKKEREKERNKERKKQRKKEKERKKDRQTERNAS
jgi:hypothetical protein